MTKISVKLSKELRHALADKGHKSESYDQIIRRLIPFEVPEEKREVKEGK